MYQVVFQSDKKVNHVVYYNDPSDDNADYDAVTWISSVTGDSNFQIEMPMSELFKKDNTPYVLRLRFCHDNGDISTFSYAYSFKDGEPVIEFGDRDNFDRSNWSVIDFSSEQSGEEAIKVLDGDRTTFWHSRWSQNATSYPHHLTIDMGEQLEVSGFSFQQRDGQRKVKDLEIQVSDDAQNWDSKGAFQLKPINTVHHITLSNKSKFRYFKIVAKSSF